ncbi:membrane hypothetical protein [metagenome]|uniref:DUF7224 domain-containing protein n=1 Tax=metagenome TaxID=256318 RepID=A0A2P2C9G2_9ZZZZ
MRLPVAARRSGVVWFLPLLFAFGSLHSVDALATHSGYAVSDIASSSYVIYVLCPLLAGYAAFASRGWARFHAPLRTSRSGLRVALNAWGSLAFGGVIVVVSTVVLSAWVVPRDRMTWLVLLLDAATVFACVLFGLAAAWALPVVVAAPVVALVTFVWICYLPATGSEFLHYLTPTLTGCCAQSVQPSGVAARSILLIASTVALGVIVMLSPQHWSRRPRWIVGATVLLVLGTAFGLAATSVKLSDEHLLLTTVEPRTGALTCGRTEGVEVCVWPEGKAQAAVIADVAADMNTSLDAWGFPEITEAGNGSQAGERVMVESTPSISSATVGYSLAQGYVRLHLACAQGGRQVIDPRVAFLAMGAGGATANDLAGEFSPDEIAVASGWLERADEGSATSDWFFDERDAGQCRSSR